LLTPVLKEITEDASGEITNSSLNNGKRGSGLAAKKKKKKKKPQNGGMEMSVYEDETIMNA
jgi:hypothetical protein